MLRWPRIPCVTRNDEAGAAHFEGPPVTVASTRPRERTTNFGGGKFHGNSVLSAQAVFLEATREMKIQKIAEVSIFEEKISRF